MERLLLLLMLTAALGFNQTAAGQSRPAARKAPSAKPAAKPAAPVEKWPIRAIVIEGNHLFTAAQVTGVTGLKLGQVAGKPEFDAAYNRLLATGAFEKVNYRFEPVPGSEAFVATFQVTEVEPAYPIRFDRLGVPDKDLKEALAARDPLFGPRLPATKAIVDRYTGWVQECMAAHGITEPITARVITTGPDQFEIVFRPKRNEPAVAQVSFSGNNVIPADTLRQAIAGVAVGQLYTEERFRTLLDTAVRPLYEARGRIRVAFPQLRCEAVKDVEGLHVFVTVNEGESYNLGGLEIAGPVPVKPGELLKAAKLTPGDLANFDLVHEAQERMLGMVRRAGYVDATVSSERRIDDAKKTVGLAFRFEPGPQYMMGALSIVGLDLNGEFEIKRIWSLKEGKPFNPEYPDYFLGRVKEDGLFDGLGETKAEVKLNSAARTAAVTLRFGAAPHPTEKKRRRDPGSNLPI